MGLETGKEKKVTEIQGKERKNGAILAQGGKPRTGGLKLLGGEWLLFKKEYFNNENCAKVQS